MRNTCLLSTSAGWDPGAAPIVSVDHTAEGAAALESGKLYMTVDQNPEDQARAAVAAAVNLARGCLLYISFNCHKKVVKKKLLVGQAASFSFKISKNRNLFCAEWLLQNGSKGLQ